MLRQTDTIGNGIGTMIELGVITEDSDGQLRPMSSELAALVAQIGAARTAAVAAGGDAAVAAAAAAAPVMEPVAAAAGLRHRL